MADFGQPHTAVAVDGATDFPDAPDVSQGLLSTDYTDFNPINSAAPISYTELKDSSTSNATVLSQFKDRIIVFNNADETVKFKNNSIQTTKYSIFTFFPKFLFEQFRKAANAFFFVIALLQQIPGVSPTGRFTTAVPLTIIMMCTAVKEIIEDWGRMNTDKKINNSETLLLRNGDWQPAKWKDVKVGDFVKVKNDHLFPSDILLLCSSELKGICYIETANLDGETNLKVRQSLAATSEIKDKATLLSLKGELVCEPPDDDTTKFKGSVTLFGERYPVTLNQFLMRGTCLRKTSFVIGIVVYTGVDTKVMMNSKPVPLKRSKVEQESNRYFLLLLAILFFFTLFTTFANLVWTKTAAEQSWYIPNNAVSIASFGSVLVTSFIMFHTIVPISLQVTLEMMHVIQAYFISSDLDMYDADNDIAAEARTSSLNEELGQINYIFSDKTGTLTQNCMIFQGATVAGKIYGDVNSTGALDEAPMLVSGEAEIVVDLASNPSNELSDFLSILAVCHTVIPEKDSHGNVRDYSASSPDESALVHAARRLGYELFERHLDTFVTIRVNEQMRTYEVLARFEFTSDRKRMSMVVKCPDNSIKVFVKGADSVIYKRLGSNKFTSETTAHMEKFARAGLRTLCIAVAELRVDEWTSIRKDYEIASNNIEHRETMIAKVAERVEKNLHLLGATAIEDKLQLDVPKTIDDILKAGIKMWVLTGDKLETAINIGYSCRLLQSDMDVRTLQGSTLDEVRNRLHQLVQLIGRDNLRKENNMAVVLEGECLTFAGTPDCLHDLMDVLLSCRTVICCRVSPKQKADIVKYVKDEVKDAITLAIGDGANDVSMLQESHVGVGLKGKEGLQAAAASDYSFSQFRFLKKLLLVHGAWSYHRVTIVILYSFYKNITLYVNNFWFALFSGFSGQVMFEKWTQGLYNVFFTGATPFALGMFDRSCSPENCMKYPQLYKENLNSSRYNFRVFALWMFNGVYHSAVIFVCTMLTLQNEVPFSDGKASGLYYFGGIVYLLAVLTVVMKAGLEHTAWTWLSHFAIWGSIGNYIVFIFISSNLYPLVKENFSEVVGFDQMMFSSASFYCLVFLVPFFALTRDICWKAYKFTMNKTLREQVMEMEKLRQDPSTILFQGTYRKMTEKARLIKQAIQRGFKPSASYASNLENAETVVPPGTPREFDRTSDMRRSTGFAFSQDDNPTVSQADYLRSTCPAKDSSDSPPQSPTLSCTKKKDKEKDKDKKKL